MVLRASRRSAIAPFLVLDVLRAAMARDRVAAGPEGRTIHLEIGQPGGAAPQAVLDAAAAAVTLDLDVAAADRLELVVDFVGGDAGCAVRFEQPVFER